MAVREEKQMKKISVLVLALSLCLLSGCGETFSSAQTSAPEQTPVVEELPAEEGHDLVFANGLRYEGECSAKKSSGLFEGSGSFRSNEGWSFTGSFSEGRIDVGTVDELPYTLSFGGVKIHGSYSGEVKELVPSGKGSFTARDGGGYSGSFSDGRTADGRAEALQAGLYIGNCAAEGSYTGSVAGGTMDGQGVFVCESGRIIRYEGGFSKGEPSGRGTLRDSGFICLNGDSRDRGVFEGATLDGLPQGQGSFKGRSSDNIDYSYTGSWGGGLFEGEGRLIYDSELFYDRVGHFTAGRYTPTPLEMLESLGSVGQGFTLSETTRAYLEKFPEFLKKDTLLKTCEAFDYKGEVNQLLTFRNYMSDPERFEGKFMYVFNDHILYRNTVTVFGADCPVGVYVVSNTLYEEPFVCYFFGTLSSFDSAKVINCFGIPLGETSYTNADGDEVPAIALLVGAATTY